MAILFPHHNMQSHRIKRIRRNATSVMAGTFDIHPPRDVLTSLLNGVGPYKAVERDEEARQQRKKEKREREKEKRRSKTTARALQKTLLADADPHASIDGNIASTSLLLQPLPVASASTSSFWRARPTIHIPAIQRSVSVTPSPTSSPRPLDLPLASTPGHSVSSSTSRTSSKRPRTPADDEVIGCQSTVQPPPPPARPRKKREAVRKGWKGWVEGSPRRVNIGLDSEAPVFDGRTRSGKHFTGCAVKRRKLIRS